MHNQHGNHAPRPATLWPPTNTYVWVGAQSPTPPTTTMHHRIYGIHCTPAETWCDASTRSAPQPHTATASQPRTGGTGG